MSDIADIAAALRRTEFSGELCYAFASRIDMLRGQQLIVNERGVLSSQLFENTYSVTLVTRKADLKSTRTDYCVAATVDKTSQPVMMGLKLEKLPGYLGLMYALVLLLHLRLRSRLLQVP